MGVSIYIDGNNLYRSAKTLGFSIDYKKFRGWLRQKYNAEKVYLFIGLIQEHAPLYQTLQEAGFLLVFKPTIVRDGVVKGNCDAELVLTVVSHAYEQKFTQCIIVTGDGDFACLVDFLKERNQLHSLLAPRKQSCSSFLLRKNIHLDFLDAHYSKFNRQVPRPQK